MSVKKTGFFFNIELRPYRYGCVVSIGQTDAQIKAEMAKVDHAYKTKRSRDVMRAGIENPVPGYVVTWEADSFMRIREIPDTVQVQGVVIHELLHVVRHCLKTRGINMAGRGGQEAYCYLLEEAWNEVMGRVRAVLNE